MAMKNMVMSHRTSICFGIVLVSIASALAFVWHYHHFYELMLAGLLLIFGPFVPKGTFSKRRIVKLYLVFILAALTVDLLLGLAITKAWYYTYSGIFEYVILYAWTYPAGGFVMVQSYIIAYTLFTRDSSHDHPINARIFWAVLAFFAAATFTILLSKKYLAPSLWGVLFGASAVLTLCSATALRCEIRGKRSYLRDIISHPRAMFVGTFLATFANLLIHEYPNVYAREWVYRSDILILGIPLFIWLAWPLLTIGSVSLFYKTDEAYSRGAKALAPPL